MLGGNSALLSSFKKFSIYSKEENFAVNGFGIPHLGLPLEPVLYSSKQCGIMVKGVESGVNGLGLNPKTTIYCLTRSNYFTTVCLTFFFFNLFAQRQKKIGGGRAG